MKYFFTACLLGVSLVAFSQDELLQELQGSVTKTNDPVIGTFSGTRIVNGHSVETRSKNVLEFIITHRFGTINSGAYEAFGLDNSVVRIGFEYGITDRLMVGIGRTSSDKTFDYFGKDRALRQSDIMPLSVTVFGSAAYLGLKNEALNELSTTDKMAYATQLVIARKLSSRVSLQVSPSYLYRTTVDQDIAVNNLISLGMGGRFKLTKSMALVLEYYLRLNEKSESPYNDALGMSLEFETGGHVFQLVFTNSQGMVERQFMAETSGDFFDGDIHFGFNITRAFPFGRKK
ncbi:MAG TPA: DUF5777 family beta-barrel protein [Cyclobacteriaceae bacterium]|nr:DUF5777 family beta-barrel protein [Cyclobacteriaceae bacterium]